MTRANLPLHCECTWVYHRGAPCFRAPYDPGIAVVPSPALCAPCLYACEGERHDRDGLPRGEGVILSMDQRAVLGILQRVGRPMTPSQVAAEMGNRTPAGIGHTLSSLHRNGLLDRRRPTGGDGLIYSLVPKVEP